MWSFRRTVCCGSLSMVFCAGGVVGLGQQTSADVPTIKLNSTLVFLDVTVVDKKGRPVVKGLTQDDFTITEGKKPQRIFSFEAPELHKLGRNAKDEGQDAKAPVTIFVLDLLNSSFEDIGYIRYSVRKFLDAQPERLNAPAEMMVIGDWSFEMIQGYTRDKQDLLYALDHLPAVNPFKVSRGSFTWERFEQSMDALQQIALQNDGVEGRKNIVWVGRGGPGINSDRLLIPNADKLQRYIHTAANMLVDARISLFVIYPGLKVSGRALTKSEGEAEATLGNDDPFAGDINFGLFVNETGGKLFYNRNDVDAEMEKSVKMGSEYYTLTYQPHDVTPDGKFRRIRVALRDPNLHAVTKAGYFAPEKDQPSDPREEMLVHLAEAVRATIPFTALPLKVTKVVRHPDTRTAEITVQTPTGALDWLPTETGSSAGLIMAAASLNGSRNILASKLEMIEFASKETDPAKHPNVSARVTVTLRMPRSAQDVRVVLRTEQEGRMGAVEVSRKTLDAAPATPTPEPQLAPKPAVGSKD